VAAGSLSRSRNTDEHCNSSPPPRYPSQTKLPRDCVYCWLPLMYLCVWTGARKRSRSADEQRDGTRSPSAPQADVTMDDAPDAQQPPAAGGDGPSGGGAGGEGAPELAGGPIKQQKLEDGSMSPSHQGGSKRWINWCCAVLCPHGSVGLYEYVIWLVCLSLGCSFRDRRFLLRMALSSWTAPISLAMLLPSGNAFTQCTSSSLPHTIAAACCCLLRLLLLSLLATLAPHPQAQVLLASSSSSSQAVHRQRLWTTLCSATSWAR
jgi:hypothetical protein